MGRSGLFFVHSTIGLFGVLAPVLIPFQDEKVKERKSLGRGHWAFLGRGLLKPVFKGSVTGHSIPGQ